MSTRKLLLGTISALFLVQLGSHLFLSPPSAAASDRAHPARRSGELARASLDAQRAQGAKAGNFWRKMPTALPRAPAPAGGTKAAPPAAGGARVSVSIGAIFRGEARYIIEWIEYHALIGVGHFYLASNECGAEAEASRALLRPYVQRGLVSLLPEFECRRRGFQNAAYGALLRRARGRTDWLALLDVDEFVHLQQANGTIEDALRGLEDFDAVALLWRLFGTSGHQRAPEGSVLHNYVLRASTSAAKDSRARSFKSMLRPEACAQMATHMCARFACQAAGAPPSKRCGCTASTDGKQCVGAELLGKKKGRPPFAKLWLHHYRTKSGQDWEAKKARGRADVGEGAAGAQRTGPPPAEYDCVRDDKLPRAVEARLARLADRAEAERLGKLLLAGPGPRLRAGRRTCTDGDSPRPR